jgi:hypothetical protein
MFTKAFPITFVIRKTAGEGFGTYLTKDYTVNWGLLKPNYGSYHVQSTSIAWKKRIKACLI